MPLLGRVLCYPASIVWWGACYLPLQVPAHPLSLLLPEFPLLCCWYVQVVRNERSSIVIPSVALPLFQQALGVAVGMINS